MNDPIEPNFWDDRTTPDAYGATESAIDMAKRHERMLFKQYARKVEEQYQMGGLSDGLYEDYAWDIYQMMKGIKPLTTNPSLYGINVVVNEYLPPNTIMMGKSLYDSLKGE